MQLYVPFENYTQVGGPATFMANLKNALDKLHFEYLKHWEEGCAVFFPVQYDLSVLYRTKKTGGKIIQRLDGIYYPSKHGNAYKKLNRLLKIIYLHYSDFVIFQSYYSREQCFKMLGSIPEKRYRIIYNGVDKSLFYPSNKNIRLSNSITFITTGNFRNRDMLEPVVKALDLIDKQFKFTLLVVGPVPSPELVPLLNRHYIKYMGTLKLEEIADLLRTADIFLYSHLNPPCPNSVIEAIASGIPVVGFNSGSMAELLSFAPELLADVSDEVFQNYADFDYNKLKDKILLAVQHFDYFKSKALKHAYLYDMQDTAKQYGEVFQLVLSDRFPVRKLSCREYIRFNFSRIKNKMI